MDQQHDDDLRRTLDAAREADQRLRHDLGWAARRRGSGSGYVTRLGRAPAEDGAAEAALVRDAQNGDDAARAQLVERYLPVVARMARTYRSGQVQHQELLQEGVVGILRALEGFDPDRGVPFWGYASWWVRQAMQQLVSELTRPFVLSDRALRHLSRLKQAHHDAVLATGREPTREQLARRTDLELGQVDDLLAAERRPRSLEEPRAGSEGELGSFGDLLVDPLAEEEYARVLAAVEVDELHGLLAGLSDRERAVLRARYGLDGEERSLREIGEALGVSGERVRQIERRALDKLGSSMGAASHRS